MIDLMHIRYLQKSRKFLDFLFYFCKTMVHQRYSTCFNYLVLNLSLLPYTVLISVQVIWDRYTKYSANILIVPNLIVQFFKCVLSKKNYHNERIIFLLRCL